MPKSQRPIRIEGDTAFIQLTKGYTTAIDVADVALAEGRNWCSLIAPHTVYAQGKINNKTVFLHRLLLGFPSGLDVDHIDGDGLNNRRSNLREATRSQNLRNQRVSKDSASGLKGITWYPDRAKWGARIKVDGRRLWLGLYETPESAHAAYVAASAEHHAEFGRSA